ncbi:MAG TPA: hypothetical protein VF599_15915 [Pyrinomonadaceae bacterium]
MKLVSIIFLCLFLALAASAQPPVQELPQPENEIVGVEEIYLAKDNGEGKAGDAETNFLTTDIPIFCIVQLNSTKPATVKMNFIVVKVAGVKAETKVVSVSYKTNGKQNRVNFTGSPEGAWIAGSYRVDVFVDGKLAGSKELEIQKSAPENPAVKSFQPKTNAKPKSIKRTRKN